MHPSSVEHVEHCIRTYLDKDRHYRVLDIGSWARPHEVTHRDLLAGYRSSYFGVDITDGFNVDRVLSKPYRIPLRSGTVDLVVSGQVFEHVPFVWATMFEVARVLRPDGLAFVVAPSRGHPHNVQDLWRFYPDGMRALAAHSGLGLLEAHTDFPPTRSDGRHDYASIDPGRYWGDSVAVFRRPQQRPGPRALAARAIITAWANHVGGIEDIPRPKRLPARRRWQLPKRAPEEAGRPAPGPTNVEAS